MSYQDQWVLWLILWSCSLQRHVICTQASLELRENKAFCLLPMPSASMLGSTQSCERGSHLNPHCSEHQDFGRSLNQTVYLQFSPFQFSRANQPLPSAHYPLPPHLKGITFSFWQNQRQAEMLMWELDMHKNSSTMCSRRGTDRDAHSLWNSSEVDINKEIVINLNSGKVERILTASVWRLRGK